MFVKSLATPNTWCVLTLEREMPNKNTKSTTTTQVYDKEGKIILAVTVVS